MGCILILLFGHSLLLKGPFGWDSSDSMMRMVVSLAALAAFVPFVSQFDMLSILVCFIICFVRFESSSPFSAFMVSILVGRLVEGDESFRSLAQILSTKIVLEVDNFMIERIRRLSKET
jgi:hypothetical protein